MADLEVFTQRIPLVSVIGGDKARVFIGEHEEMAGQNPDTLEVIRKGFVGEVVKEPGDLETGERAVISYITTKAIDRDREVLLPKGADLTWYEKNPVVMYGHDYSSLPIGRNEWIKADRKGLKAKTVFASHAFAEDVWHLYKDQFLRAWSVGFMSLKAHVPEKEEFEDGEDVARVYDKWVLLEYSAVPVPCNQEALTVAIAKGMMLSGKLLKDLGMESKSVVMPPEPCEHCKALEKRIVVVKQPVESMIIPMSAEGLGKLIRESLAKGLRAEQEARIRDEIARRKGRVVEHTT